MAWPVLAHAGWRVTPCGDLDRPETPAELSGITWTGGDAYFAVDDKDGRLYRMTLNLDRESGEPTNLVMGAGVRIAPDAKRAPDLEGVARDPLLPGCVWIADEETKSIGGFDIATGRRTGAVPIPKVQRQARMNRSLESVAIAPEGLVLWTANEEALVCDGPPASRKAGTVVRLTKFTRPNARAPWRLAGEWRYRTDPVGGEPWRGRMNSGVADLVAPDARSLIVLERELSKKGPFPTFRMRLYAADVSGKPGGAEPVAKALVHDEDTVFANIEGICLGPMLRDGSRALVAVSDGGGNAAETVQTYRIVRTER